MANEENGLQLCPTPVDGHHALFAHKISSSLCQDRQRGSYHKCWTCQYNNAWVAKHGRPTPKDGAPKDSTSRETASNGTVS
jgi:hypothetical protein